MTIPARGLSCYTANLLGYLEREPWGEELFVRSTQLTLRRDGTRDRLAFSHHSPPLDRLPDGSTLTYRGAACPEAAVPILLQQLARYRRVLVVANAAALPWSKSNRPAPHWLLLSSYKRRRWLVTDHFAALYADGTRHDTFSGWIDHQQLSAVLRLPVWTPAQDLRNRLALGREVDVPANQVLCLERTVGDHQPLPHRNLDLMSELVPWLGGGHDLLPSLIAACMFDPNKYLEDVWAVARHRAFLHERRRSGETMATSWLRLPPIMQIAVESASRERPRPNLVRAAWQDILAAEEALVPCP